MLPASTPLVPLNKGTPDRRARHRNGAIRKKQKGWAWEPSLADLCKRVLQHGQAAAALDQLLQHDPNEPHTMLQFLKSASHTGAPDAAGMPQRPLWPRNFV